MKGSLSLISLDFLIWEDDNVCLSVCSEFKVPLRQWRIRIQKATWWKVLEFSREYYILMSLALEWLPVSCMWHRFLDPQLSSDLLNQLLLPRSLSYGRLPNSAISLAFLSPSSPLPYSSRSHQILEIQTPRSFPLPCLPAMHIVTPGWLLQPWALSLLPVSPRSHSQDGLSKTNQAICQSLALTSFPVSLPLLG